MQKEVTSQDLSCELKEKEDKDWKQILIEAKNNDEFISCELLVNQYDLNQLSIDIFENEGKIINKFIEKKEFVKLTLEGYKWVKQLIEEESSSNQDVTKETLDEESFDEIIQICYDEEELELQFEEIKA